MKLNIAYPATGCQKLIEIEDDRKLRVFFDKKMAQEVPGDSLGDEWKGYVFRIGGGNDKQGSLYDGTIYILYILPYNLELYI